MGGHSGSAAAQRKLGSRQSPLAPRMHKASSRNSQILFGRGAAFGLSGSWDPSEQNHSSRKACLTILISTLSPTMHFRVLKGYLKKRRRKKKKYISSSYLMWLSKMFLVIYKNNGSGLGRTKGRTQDGGGEGYFFKSFRSFLGVGGDHTEGRQELHSLVQTELCRKRYLPGQFPCHKGRGKPTWSSADCTERARTSLPVSIPSDGHTWLVRLHGEPTSQQPSSPKASFLLVGYKTTSVTNRRVFNTLNHDRLQEVSQFRYALVYYYHIYIFILFIYFFC